MDTVNNKLTLDDSGSTVLNVDPKNTAFIVNGKPGALTDLANGMTVHAVVSLQMDFDGIADRVIHYCQDNSISYKSSIPDSAFTDADGLDDVKLISAFNAADTPTINPSQPIPGDAVTGSGSGLDPHISPENADLAGPARGGRPQASEEASAGVGLAVHRPAESRLSRRSRRKRPDAEHRAGQARSAAGAGRRFSAAVEH